MLSYFQRLRSKKRGFTLIELIIVIAILGILAAILVPTMLKIVDDSRKSVDQANARSVFSIARASLVSLSTEGKVSVEDIKGTGGTDDIEGLKSKIIANLEDDLDKDCTIYYKGTEDDVTGVVAVKYGEGEVGVVEEGSFSFSLSGGDEGGGGEGGD